MASVAAEVDLGRDLVAEARCFLWNSVLFGQLPTALSHALQF